MVTGHMEKDGFHPHSSGQGIRESDILGNPTRDKFGKSATPMSEKKATLHKISGYAKDFNKRVTEANKAGKARSDEQKAARERQNREADKNLEIAGKFLTNAELLRQGKAPTEKIDINIENNATRQKLPKHVTPEQKKEIDKKQEQQSKNEYKVIEKIAKSSQTPEPEIPIMPQGPPSYTYSESSEQEPTPQQQSKSKQSFDELALEAYPVSG